MSLKLGSRFNRTYTLRIPFMNGYYNIGIYYDKKSTFLLFQVDPDFSETTEYKHNIKINMFKNLEASRFCETFIELHNYRKNTLDISNQFNKIKPEYTNDVSFVFNESVILSKVEIDDGREVYDSLTIYGLTMTQLMDEFIFIITERQNIIKRLGKKVVRTSGIQISTNPALTLMDEYHQERKNKIFKSEDFIKRDTIIKV
jgi:hypothetical protein